MSNEIKQVMGHFKDMSAREFVISEGSMLRVLKAFLLYRPDFGYSQVNFLKIEYKTSKNIEHVLFDCDVLELLRRVGLVCMLRKFLALIPFLTILQGTRKRTEATD